MYWATSVPKVPVLRSNPRFGAAGLGLRRRCEDEHMQISAQTATFVASLAQG